MTLCVKIAAGCGCEMIWMCSLYAVLAIAQHDVGCSYDYIGKILQLHKFYTFKMIFILFCLCNQSECERFLLEAGANPNCIDIWGRCSLSHTTDSQCMSNEHKMFYNYYVYDFVGHTG